MPTINEALISLCSEKINALMTTGSYTDLSIKMTDSFEVYDRMLVDFMLKPNNLFLDIIKNERLKAIVESQYLTIGKVIILLGMLSNTSLSISNNTIDSTSAKTERSNNTKYRDTYASAIMLICLGRCLTLEAYDGNAVINDIRVFHALLQSVVSYTARFKFTKFSASGDDITDVRYKLFQWVDYCICYRYREKSQDINDIIDMFKKYSVGDVEQTEEINTLENYDATDFIYCYGLYMNNFLPANYKLYDYLIPANYNDNIYKRLTISKPKKDNISFYKLPPFCISLLSRISRDIGYLQSTHLQKLNTFNNEEIIRFDTNESITEVLSFNYPQLHMISFMRPPADKNNYTTIKRYDMSEEQVAVVTDYHNTLLSQDTTIKLKDDKGLTKAFKNPLCNHTYATWKKNNNSFLYTTNMKKPISLIARIYEKREGASIANQNIMVNFKQKINAGNNWNIRSIRDTENTVDNNEDTLTHNNTLYAGALPDNIQDRITVVQSDGIINAATKNTVTVGDYINDNILSDDKTSKVIVFMGSSGAGKTTTIALLNYVSTYLPHPLTDEYIKSFSFGSTILKTLTLPNNTTNVSYKAIDGIYTNKNCNTTVAQSVENMKSTRNVVMTNMISMDTNNSNLLYKNNTLVVDTMGFENIAIISNAEVKLLSPLDIIMFYIINNKIDLLKFNIPDSISSSSSPSMSTDIKDYHERVMELLRSCKDLLSIISMGEKITVDSMKKMPSNNSVREFLLKYNRNRSIDKASNSKDITSLNNAMTYNIKFILLFSPIEENKRRDSQVFKLLEVISENIDFIPLCAKQLITDEHIKMFIRNT